MEEITDKQKTKSSSLSKAIKIKQGITEKESEIAKEFNKYFTSVDTALASKVPIVTKDVSEYLPQCNASMVHKELSFQEFEKAFKTLKRNKAIGCDGLNGNIIIDVYDSIKVMLFKILRHLFKKQSFLKNLKLQNLFQFLKKVMKKMLKTTDQFLFFQFFPKYLNVLCIIVCMNIS